MRNKNDDDIIYSEWVPISVFVTIAVALLDALLVAVAITSSILEPESRVLTISLCVATGLFLSLLWLNFRGLRITITETAITVKFGVLNKKIVAFSELESCEVTKSSFKTYIGFGVRIGLDSSLAFTTGFGDAVKFSFPDSRPFVFSTKKPQKICEILAKKNS